MFVLPSKAVAVASTSPSIVIVLPVANAVAVSALPVTSPVTSPVIVPDALIVVNVPAAAELAPMTAPSIAPPSMLTELAACVAIVPKPRVVLPAAASASSIILLPNADILEAAKVFAPLV